MLKPDGLTAKKSSLRSWFSRSKSREPSPHSSNTTNDAVISISQNAPPLEQPDALAVMTPGTEPPNANPTTSLVVRHRSPSPAFQSNSPTSTPTVKSESSKPDHPLRENDYGLLALHTFSLTDAHPTISTEKTYPIDIVAIHGITGDAYTTWTDPSTNTFWLRDFLPKEFPGARIYSYGYPAKVFMSLGTGRFDTFARGLLGSLRNERNGNLVSRALWHRSEGNTH